MEANTNKPTPAVHIKDITVFVDPFDEFLAKKRAEESRASGATGPSAEEKEEIARRAEDDQVTWTGKRVRGAEMDSQDSSSGIGKYLNAALADREGIKGSVDEPEPEPEPARKKVRSGGFGNFSSW